LDAVSRLAAFGQHAFNASLAIILDYLFNNPARGTAFGEFYPFDLAAVF
jgi:hypothetical protein